MKKVLFVIAAAIGCSQAFAVNLIVNNNVLTFNDPTFDRVDESGFPDGNGLEVNYQTLDFYVTQSGTYDLEMAIRSSNESADTYLLLYSPGLTPSDATQNFVAGNDDSSAALTVLSGSYFSANSGRSAIHGLALTGNTQYQAVFTTFDFTSTLFGDVTYDIGIGNGPGDAIAGTAPVPEPASLVVLGGAALAFLRSRRNKKSA